MTEWPRVSAIIPAYNAARFLGEAIESVLAQTVPVAELVVVDDGSTDDTRQIARSFPSVRLLESAHAGVSAARNAGVALTTSEWVAFLDADDTWHPRRIERQLEFAAANPAVEIVMARQSYRFEGPIPDWFRGPRDGGSEAGYMPSNWLLRRECWLRVGEFDPAMTHSEDTDWLARASDLNVLVETVDEPLVVHRIHDRNASRLAVDVKSGVLRALRGSLQRKHGETVQKEGSGG